MDIKQLFAAILTGGLLSVSLAQADTTAATTEALAAAVDNPQRTPAYVERDGYRNPQATLAFFDVQPDQQVVEIWPGGGWYTEILAPLLAAEGQLYAAHFPPQSPVAYFQKSRAAFEKRVTGQPELFAGLQVTEFYPPADVVAAPAGTAERVLTFRNVHNWLKAGYAEAAFAEFFSLLKPGGVLGVVEHRAPAGTPLKTMMESGYVTEAKVIELAEAAGFVLAARSEINANPKDTANHPAGVWTLPPTLRLGEEGRDTWLAIGESDRMTLKFLKPE